MIGDDKTHALEIKRLALEQARDENAHALALEQLALESSGFRADIIKWVVIAIGAIVSFGVIDYGRLRLEEYRATVENERALLSAYLTATEATQPDVWVRKLQVIRTLSTDTNLQEWAGSELSFIEKCAARALLYQETRRVAASLMRPTGPKDDEWDRQRHRFEELYWADLPYVGEGTPVEQAMIAFRGQLVKFDKGENLEGSEMPTLSRAMINLAKALKNDDPSRQPDCRNG